MIKAKATVIHIQPSVEIKFVDRGVAFSTPQFHVLHFDGSGDATPILEGETIEEVFLKAAQKLKENFEYSRLLNGDKIELLLYDVEIS